MDLKQAPTDASTSQPPQGQAETRIRGGWLILARVAWGVVVVLVLLLFLISLPTYLTHLQTVCLHQPCPYQQLTLNSARSLQALGISVEGYTALTLTLTLGTALVWVVMGGVLIWRRSDDWMALLVAFMLVVGGASNGLTVSATTSQAGWEAPANLLGFLFGLAIFVVFSLFPSGHFAPRWTCWLIPAFLLNSFPHQFFADWYAHLPGWANFLGLLDFVGSVLLLVLAQIYRYWRVSTSVQRQQTKWILLSLTVVVVFLLGGSFPKSFFPSLNGSLYDPVNAYLSDLGSLLFPISFAIAILRSHLWDIDIIIRRTLIYGALTASIIGIYVLIVGYLGALFHAGTNLLISLIATGLVAVLFQPLRELLQRSVNRLLYGQRDEPYRVISRLGSRLEATLAPDAVLAVIVETIAQALKLPYAAICLQQEQASPLAASYGTAAEPLFRLPLLYQSEQVGELLLAPRARGESLTPADQRLLADLVRQVGVAVHAVRLTADLQHSRERLVTAREEERRRLRRDLHDGLGPALAGFSLKVGAVRNLLLPGQEVAETLLNELSTEIEGAIADIRRIVYDLRPPSLDELGLVGALRARAAQHTLSAHPLRVLVETPEVLPAFPAAIEVAVYRIAQEALTNVVRHAGAQTCRIALSVTDEVCLEISDDGKGLPAELHPGVGLLAMRERAVELGGMCVIEAAQPVGTRVHARLPLTKE